VAAAIVADHFDSVAGLPLALHHCVGCHTVY
jgi:mono/diheme cytochrome c family protein